MSVKRRTRHGVVCGRVTGGSAVTVLGEPIVGGDWGTGCACAHVATSMPTADSRDRNVMIPPSGIEQGFVVARAGPFLILRRRSAPHHEPKKVIGSRRDARRIADERPTGDAW